MAENVLDDASRSPQPAARTALGVVRSLSLYVGLLTLFAAGTFLSPQFLTIENQRDVLWQVSSIGIIAIGMTLVILTAGIDLSVGSLLSVCSVICAMLLMERRWTPASALAVPSFAVVAAGLAGWLTHRALAGKPGDDGGAVHRLIPPAVAAIVFAAAGTWAALRVSYGFGVVGVLLLVPPVGFVLGSVSGTVIAKGNLQPFIVTLAMMISAVGLAKHVAGQGGAVHPIYYGPDAAPPAFETLASNIPVLGRELIPVPGIFFAACAVLAWLLLNKLRVGRVIFAIGGNEQAACYSGIPTDRAKILVYALAGMLSALAAVLYCAQFTQGKADAGFTRELDAIAAVVIGGTSLMGGRGSIGGTVVGVFIFGYLRNILNLRGVPSEFQDILKGLIIIVAVLLQEGILLKWIGGGYRRFADILGT